MGRSENSRNRIFVAEGDDIKTKAFDETKLTDPSLIIYSPVKVLGARTIVTNGDQTDTIFRGLQDGVPFEKSLSTRTFEPDSPNFTPRISSLIDLTGGKFSLSFSILKSDEGDAESVNRYFFNYENPRAGIGRYIHTYMENGNPLPSFEGECELLELPEKSIDDFAAEIWKNLNEENKVSLFVRYIEISSGKAESRIINKNK
jgi:IMP cyclohydrolase